MKLCNFCFQEAIAIGRTFASMKDYQLDGNREMVALGTMNVVGSMTSCYVATGKIEERIYNCYYFLSYVLNFVDFRD
jgi:MFS superfamily sulfate permease-like transporter